MYDSDGSEAMHAEKAQNFQPTFSSNPRCALALQWDLTESMISEIGGFFFRPITRRDNCLDRTKRIASFSIYLVEYGMENVNLDVLQRRTRPIFIRLIEKTMALIRHLLKVSHRERDQWQGPGDSDRLQSFSSDYRICKSHRSHTFPKLLVDKEVIQKPNADKNPKLYYIKPSSHLQLILANPQKVQLIESLPDYTANQSHALKHGRKRKDNELFQSPMVAGEVHGFDFDLWIGDVVLTSAGRYHMLLKFFTVDDVVSAVTYVVDFEAVLQSALIQSVTTNIDLSKIVCMIMSVKELTRNCRISSVGGNENGVPGLRQQHLHAINKALHARHQVPIDTLTNTNMVVRVVPLVLFSDDTSGNRSKQWNCYDTWTMNIAALPLKESNKYENHFFLCTSNHCYGHD